MDVIFGSVTQEHRDSEIARKAAELQAMEKMADEHEETKV
jgi:hypothetical protein